MSRSISKSAEFKKKVYTSAFNRAVAMRWPANANDERGTTRPFAAGTTTRDILVEELAMPSRKNTSRNR